MIKWKNIANAPKNKVLFLWGHIDPKSKFPDLKWEKPTLFVGYWDSIDGAWCPLGATWQGPFMKCYYWAEIPSDMIPFQKDFDPDDIEKKS